MPPTSNEMLSSRCQTFVAGIAMYSAKQPSRSTPMIFVYGQTCELPVRQSTHRPSTMWPSAVTRSPTRTSVTRRPDLRDFTGELVADDHRRLEHARAPTRPSRRCARPFRRRRRAARGSGLHHRESSARERLSTHARSSLFLHKRFHAAPWLHSDVSARGTREARDERAETSHSRA